MLGHAFLSASLGESMTMSQNETRGLIEQVLAVSSENARLALHNVLRSMGRTEPEFCAGVIEHQAGIELNSDQWLDLFIKIPNPMFLRESKLWLSCQTTSALFYSSAADTDGESRFNTESATFDSFLGHFSRFMESNAV
jgi:hypothetical protein